jgi:hypothetical protein
MTKNQGKNKLSRIVSGMWLLNFAGAIGLFAFFWASSIAPQSNLEKEPPAFVSTVTETSINQTAASTPDKFFNFRIGTIEIREYHDPATPTPDTDDWSENPKVIGYSVAGRPIEVYRFGNGPTGRMIVAGIHGGNEWNTIKLAKELISYIQEHPEIIPENITLYILPNLNPDGEARAHGVDGRVNDNGVDLNRNWPYRWERDYDRSSCWHYRPTTAGDYAASEPETSALLVFIVSHPEIDALISYHAAALGIFAGGVPDYQPSIRLAKSMAKVSTYQYPPIDVGCTYTGNLTDWASSTREIAAVDIELHNFRQTDFDENLKILKVFLKYKK